MEDVTINTGSENITVDASFSGCDEQTKADIKAKLKEALESAHRALNKLQNDKKAGVEKWFGKSNADKYDDWDSAVKRLVPWKYADGKYTSYSFVCEPCCDKDTTIAYVKGSSFPIHLCPKYSDITAEDILHELTHIKNFASDFAYGGPDDYTYPKTGGATPTGKDGKMSDKDLTGNADTIAGWVTDIGTAK